MNEKFCCRKCGATADYFSEILLHILYCSFGVSSIESYLVFPDERSVKEEKKP